MKKFLCIVCCLLSVGLFAQDNPIIVEEITPEPGTIQFAENQSLTFLFSGYDPDQNALSYSWMLDNSVVSTDSLFNFDTNFDSAGEYLLVLNVSDSLITRNDTVFTWNVTVTDVDQAIVVTNLSPVPAAIEIDETDSLNFSFEGYDPDGNELVINWKVNDVTVDQDSIFTFYSDYNSAGFYDILLTISDQRNFHQFSWSVTVNDVDQPIEVTSLQPAPGTINLKEGSETAFQFAGYDPDGNDLLFEWQLDSVPVSTTANFSFTPGYNATGNHLLNLTVTDGYSGRNDLVYQWDITVERASLLPVPDDFLTIQAAIDYATDGDTVMVDPGTYYENIIFNKNILVTSLYQQSLNRTMIDSTIINGNLFGRIVTFDGSVSNSAILNGFTLTRGSAANGAGLNITNGNMPTISNCKISDHAGNGIYINGASPVIKHTIINQCYATGITIDGNNASNVTLDGVEISNNNGRGIETSYAIVNAQNCLIYGNSTTLNGGAISAFASQLYLTNTTIVENEANQGGGLYTDTACNIIISNSILFGNTPDNVFCNLINYPNTLSISYSDLENDYQSLLDNDNLNLLWGDDNIDIDPWFSDEENQDFSLHQFSRLIGAGTLTNCPDHDLYNNPRPAPADSNPDLGAIENPLATAADQIIVIESLTPEPGDYTISETDSLTLICSAYDPDGNEIEFNWSLDSQPTDYDSSYTFLTDYDTAGDHIVTLQLNDNYNTRNDTIFTWNVTVLDVDRPIVVDYILPVEDSIEIAETDSILFEFSGYDPDGNELDYSWQYDSLEVGIDSIFVLYTDYTSAGIHFLWLEVTDNFSRSTFTQQWEITITQTDQAIVINSIAPPPGDYTISETDSLNFSCSSYDPDGNAVEFNWLLDSQPVDNDSSYTFLTNYDTAGDHIVTLQLSDNFITRNDTIFTWNVTVLDVDQPIMVREIYPETDTVVVAEGSEQEFICSAYDPDGNDLGFSWQLDSILVSEDSLFICQPDYEAAGNHNLTLQVTDNFDEATGRNTIFYEWSIIVTDTDQPIFVNALLPAPGAVTVSENDSIHFVFSGFDPDGNNLEYLWKIDEEPVSTDSSFVFSTDYESAGDYFVTLNITDNYGTRDDKFFIWYVEVLDVDRPIEIIWTTPALGSISMNEIDSLLFGAAAVDPDSNLITYNWLLNSEPVSTDSAFLFVTDYSSAGIYTIDLQLSDNFSNVRNDTTLTWNVTVNDVDQMIVVDSLYPAPGAISVSEGDSLDFGISAYDPDGNPLQYSWLWDSLPVGADSLLQLQLDYQSAGEHILELVVDDGFNNRNQLNYNWYVTVSDIDQPIQVNLLEPEPGPLQIAENNFINFTFSGFDPDGNTLSYQWILDSLLVSSDSTFSFITDFQSEGIYNLTLSVSDNYNSRDIIQYNWIITVIESDQSIIVTAINPMPGLINMAETDSLLFSFSGYDPDGSVLDYHWLLDGISVGNDSLYLYTTNYQSAGTHSLQLQVTDNFMGSFARNDTTFSWQIDVNETDQSIIVTDLSPQPSNIVLLEGEEQVFSFSGYDPDGNLLDYVWTYDNQEVGYDSLYTLITDYGSAGTHQLTLLVSDNFGTTRNDTIFTWDITIEDVDQVIVIEAITPQLGDVVLFETDSLLFSCSAYDPDGNSLNYQWIMDSLTVSNDSIFLLQTDYESAGIYSLNLIIDDGFTARNDTIFTWQITVHETDQPIVVTDLSPQPGLLVIEETQYLLFQFTGYDPDGNELIYQWTLDDSLISTESVYFWQTDYESAGNHIVNLEVSDGFVNTRNDTTYTWQINVTENDRPIIITQVLPDSQNIIIQESEELHLAINAYDPDGETIQYNWLVNAIPVSNDSIYIFTTDYNSAGTYQIMAELTDDWGVRNDTTITWNVIVEDVDQAIVVYEISPDPGGIDVNENSDLFFSFSGYDPDGNLLDYLWILNDETVSTDSTFLFTTDYSSAGFYSLNLQVSDGYRDNLEYQWNIEVIDMDQNISVTEIEPEPGSYEIMETESINFQFSGFDPDGNELEYIWLLNDNIVSSDSIYSFVTDYNSYGSYQLILSVTDNFNRNLISYEWNIEVTNLSLINVPVDIETISEAIIQAGEGDTIIVHPGTYTESIAIQNKDITLSSLYLTTGDHNYIDQTILDGNESNCVATFNGVPGTSRFSGFTITNGFSFFGGAIKCSNGSQLQIDHLKIENNEAAYGGGFYINSSSPVIDAVILSNNIGNTAGGGLYLSNSNSSLTNLLISSNTSSAGGAIKMIASTPEIFNSTIVYNTSNSVGGISIENSSPIIKNSILAYNNAFAVYNSSGTPVISSSNIFNNGEFDFFNCDSELGLITTTNEHGDPCDIYQNLYFKPNFADTASADYHLNDFSLAIGAATLTDAPLYDIEGNPRPLPNNTSPDMGCYENSLDRCIDGSIIVNNVNPSPGIINISELDSINFVVDSYDLNGRDIDYVWFLNGSVQSYETTYTFVTDINMAGNYTLTLHLDDDWINRADTTLVWNIHVADLDQAIVIDSLYPTPGDIEIAENQNLEFICLAYDPDGNSLDYTWILNAEEVDNDSIYSFETDFDSAGEYLLTLYLSDETDNRNQTRNDTLFVWNVTVLDIDRWIVVDSLYPAEGDLEIAEGDTLDFCFFGYDPDGNNLQYIWNFDSEPVSNDSSFTYIADFYSAGVHDIQLLVSDSVTRNDTLFNWQLLIADIDQGPIITGFSPEDSLIISEGGTEITFSLDCYDPDGDPLLFQWFIDDQLNSTDSLFTHIFGFQGNYEVKGVVSSNGLAKANIWLIEITTSNESNDIPLSTVLHQNSPNPFNPQTSIDFALSKPTHVRLEIFNLRGRKIKSLIDKDLQPGSYHSIWDGNDTNGKQAASGIYLYRLITDSKVFQKKMIMLK